MGRTNGSFELLLPDRRQIRRWFLAVCALGGCAPQPPPPRTRPEIIPGEVLVHTGNTSLLTTKELSAATGREDFVVKQVSCFLKTCRVVVERIGPAADERWTYALVDAIGAARVPGIDGVEPSTMRSR
jgi:hypothetical protein